MTDGKQIENSKFNDDVQNHMVENMHKTLLEALRHREQEIIRYIAILTPALVGFIWLIREYINDDNNAVFFTIGTVGVIFLLLVGAFYSLSLGYNYRCITMQLAKLEALTADVNRFILAHWPRTPKDFKKYKRCYPPEIIKTFWLAFTVGMAGVTAIGLSLLQVNGEWKMKAIILIVGTLCLCIDLKAPYWYGSKFEKARKKEEKEGTW